MSRSSTFIEVGLDGTTAPSAPPPLDGTTAPSAPPPPCSSLDCFSDLVRRRAKHEFTKSPRLHGTVVLAMTNAGFAPFWHNLRCSLERVNVSQHAIIIGTDDDACAAASSDSVPCVVGDRVLWDRDGGGGGGGKRSSGRALSQSIERHGTVEYARLMHIKARPALAVLKMGYNLLFTDTDIVFFDNPLARLRGAYGAQLDNGELDVLIQSDYDESNEAECDRREESHHVCRSSWCDVANGRCEDEACGGFYYLRAGEPAVALLEGLFARMAWQRKHQDKRIGEQPALNYVLRRTEGLRYQLLPRQKYPNGNAFFLRHPPKTKLPVIVHNNWIAGGEMKRQRFEEHGLWLVKDDGSNACIDAALAPPRLDKKERKKDKKYRPQSVEETRPDMRMGEAARKAQAAWDEASRVHNKERAKLDESGWRFGDGL